MLRNHADTRLHNVATLWHWRKSEQQLREVSIKFWKWFETYAETEMSFWYFSLYRLHMKLPTLGAISDENVVKLIFPFQSIYSDITASGFRQFFEISINLR